MLQVALQLLVKRAGHRCRNSGKIETSDGVLHSPQSTSGRGVENCRDYFSSYFLIVNKTSLSLTFSLSNSA